MVKFQLNPAHLPRLTPGQIQALRARPVDLSDLPEIPLNGGYRPGALLELSHGRLRQNYFSGAISELRARRGHIARTIKILRALDQHHNGKLK